MYLVEFSMFTSVIFTVGRTTGLQGFAAGVPDQVLILVFSVVRTVAVLARPERKIFRAWPYPRRVTVPSTGGPAILSYTSLPRANSYRFGRLPYVCLRFTSYEWTDVKVRKIILGVV
jgi:hypothetical protein